MRWRSKTRNHEDDMTDLNLTGQAAAVAAFKPKLAAFKAQMELRRPVWDKLKRSPEKRRAWITAKTASGDPKDAVLFLAWQMHAYFAEWFGDSGDDE